MDFILGYYESFGLTATLKFATRPEQRIGTDDMWDQAEGALKAALESTGKPYALKEGDGAFYGPKIDFDVTDSIGRAWQLGTIQLDYSNPRLQEAMIEAATMGAIGIDKLEAMTCVCSVGLDMIAVPGDTPASTISAIIADEAAIGMINAKTTAVRIIPAPGRSVGDVVEFGGLLGKAPVMALHPWSSAAFVGRGGRIPAPLQGLGN